MLIDLNSICTFYSEILRGPVTNLGFVMSSSALVCFLVFRERILEFLLHEKYNR